MCTIPFCSYNDPLSSTDSPILLLRKWRFGRIRNLPKASKMSKVVNLGLEPKTIWNRNSKSLFYSFCLLSLLAYALNHSKSDHFLSDIASENSAQPWHGQLSPTLLLLSIWDILISWESTKDRWKPVGFLKCKSIHLVINHIMIYDSSYIFWLTLATYIIT